MVIYIYIYTLSTRDRVSTVGAHKKWSGDFYILFSSFLAVNFLNFLRDRIRCTLSF